MTNRKKTLSKQSKTRGEATAQAAHKTQRKPQKEIENREENNAATRLGNRETKAPHLDRWIGSDSCR